MARHFLFCIATSILMLSAGGAAAETVDRKALAGDWLLPGGDVLTIEQGGLWLHPKFGRAKVREAADAADIAVFYESGSVRCSYRLSFSEGGKTVTLSAADASQDPERCPSGALRRAGGERKGATEADADTVRPAAVAADATADASADAAEAMFVAEAAQQRQFYDARLAQAPAGVRTMVGKLRQEGQQKNWTFTVGYTKALDIPLENLAGGGKLPPDVLDIAKKQNAFAEEALKLLPQETQAKSCASGVKKFDWRRFNKVPPVRDQGQCGSCWAFAAVAAYEASYAIVNNLNIDASEQQILTCAGSGTCKGGWHWKALNWMIANGVADETTLPYAAQDKECKPNLRAPYRTAVWGFVNDKAVLPAVEQIKEAICSHGPVAAFVRATPAMQAYTGGVFNERDAGDINHIVLLAGWDDKKNAWLMKNSWSVNWGENGYMWIDYKSNGVGSVAAWVRASRPQANLSQISDLARQHGIVEGR
ncbi:MAG: C1 family peptidase [Rhodomicrobium sp.]